MEKALGDIFYELLDPSHSKISVALGLYSSTTFSNDKRGMQFQYDTVSMDIAEIFLSLHSSEGYSSANFGRHFIFFC